MGWRVIDTAEMYGDGGAEEVVGAAIAAALRSGGLARDELFVVSKVYPQNATPAARAAACESSLARLGLDHLDAYLLHWRGSVPLQETVDAFEALRARDRLRHWGVSNFDRADMEQLLQTRRRALRDQPDLLLARRARTGVRPRAMADRARHRHDGLFADRPRHARAQQRAGRHRQAARRHAAQLALAWLIAQPGDGDPEGGQRASSAREPRRGRDRAVSTDRAALDAAFPPPKRKTPLAMLRDRPRATGTQSRAACAPNARLTVYWNAASAKLRSLREWSWSTPARAAAPSLGCRSQVLVDRSR